MRPGTRAELTVTCSPLLTLAASTLEEALVPLVSMKETLDRAFAERYGVPAINIVNDLTIEAVLVAAVEERSPVILQTSVKTVKMYGPDQLYGIFAALVRDVDVPVTLHLDPQVERLHRIVDEQEPEWAVRVQRPRHEQRQRHSVQLALAQHRSCLGRQPVDEARQLEPPPGVGAFRLQRIEHHRT